MAAKLEWGAKRTCLSCGARFYDMRRDPITCPKCGEKFDPEAVFRPRRSRPVEVSNRAVPAARAKKKIPIRDDLDDEDVPFIEEEDEDEDTEDDKAEEVIEDTSDLGEDDDDISEVRERLDDDSPEREA